MIDISRLLILLNRVLERMEERGDFYIKDLPGGRVKIYKKYYCCFGLEVWKKCPKLYCPAWPCTDNLELCPHYLRSIKPQSEDTLDIDLSRELDT